MNNRILYPIGIALSMIFVILVFTSKTPSKPPSQPSQAGNTSAPQSRTAALPPLPAKWPTQVEIGTADAPGGAAGMKQIAPFKFRYQYLAGGANTGNGWSTWNPNGDFARYYIEDSIQNNIIPVFTYYMIYQSLPGGGPEGDAVTTNLRNIDTMRSYFNDLKLLFQKAGAFPNNTIVVHIEPDNWGYIQQRSPQDNASNFEVKVGATGLSELVNLPNTASGYSQAIIKLRDTYAPNVLVAYHVSVWGTGEDIVYTDPPDPRVLELGQRAANFYKSLNANFDIVFSEFSDRDAAFKQYQYNDGGAAWWNSEDFRRNRLFLKTFVDSTQKAIVMWQIPQGNTKMKAVNNTWNHYQDNRTEWFFEDPNRTHLKEYLDAGVVAFLFGRGADGATCACDANKDGVTNPAPINGNNRDSLNADDDGGYFKERIKAYYNAGPMPLGGGQPDPSPTSISNPTPTTQPGLIPADIDGDGCVGILDFNAWFQAIKGNPRAGTKPDINGDGIVDLLDFNLWFKAMQSKLNLC